VIVLRMAFTTRTLFELKLEGWNSWTWTEKNQVKTDLTTIKSLITNINIDDDESGRVSACWEVSTHDVNVTAFFLYRTHKGALKVREISGLCQLGDVIRKRFWAFFLKFRAKPCASDLNSWRHTASNRQLRQATGVWCDLAAPCTP